jgi:hypothetical protein
MKRPELAARNSGLKGINLMPLIFAGEMATQELI